MNKNEVFSKVFRWMAFGFFITFITGYVISTTHDLLDLLFSNGLYWLFIIGEFVLVITLSSLIHKIKETTAGLLFMIYSFVSGVSLSSIFILYDVSSLIYCFLITTFIFLILSAFGKTTKFDLTKISTYLYIGLFAIIITSIFNIFIGSTLLDTILSIVLVVLFCGMTAYDIQKIDRNHNVVKSNGSFAILFALELYLDFINIFINLLNLLGKSKD